MFSKEELRLYRFEIEQALKEVADKHNVNIHAGNITYTDSSFKLTLEVNKKEVAGKPFEQAQFEKYCLMFGFKPEDYGKQFVSNGKMFTITGFNLKAHKMPVLAKSIDGKGYKFPESTVKRLIAI